jgi:hypothetical protein
MNTDSFAEKLLSTRQTPLRVSFCTTCKGRLEHLQHTLPQNLAITASVDPPVEFVILAYGDQSVVDWVSEHYQNELANGKIVLASTEAEHFRMAHAKNVSQRLASGDILCNLDADNTLASGFSEWLINQFGRNPNIITCRNRAEADLTKDGLAGKIAIHRDMFQYLLGYDEFFSGWGGDDSNLLVRAQQAGIAKLHVPHQLLGDVIDHDHELRLAELSDQDRITTREKLDAREYRRSFPKGTFLHYADKLPTLDKLDDGFGYADITLHKAAGRIESLALLPVETAERSVRPTGQRSR